MNHRTCLVAAFTLLALVSGADAQSGAGADAYLATADDLYRNARQDEAIGSYQKAAEEFRRLGDIAKFAYSFNQIGIILTRQDRYEQARSYLDKALAAGLASLGPDDLTVASTYLALGVVHSAEGQFDRSLEVHGKALAIRLKRLGKFASSVATSYGNIANVHFRKQDYDQAIAAHMLALEIREKVFGPDGPEIVESFRGLGNAYREKQDYPRALVYFERALQNKIAQLGNGHRDLGRYYLQLGEVHSLAGNEAMASEYRMKAQEVERPRG
jgi:tetratricopeptide (TPR) repeat protein